MPCAERHVRARALGRRGAGSDGWRAGDESRRAPGDLRRTPLALLQIRAGAPHPLTVLQARPYVDATRPEIERLKALAAVGGMDVLDST